MCVALLARVGQRRDEIRNVWWKVKAFLHTAAAENVVEDRVISGLLYSVNRIIESTSALVGRSLSTKTRAQGAQADTRLRSPAYEKQRPATNSHGTTMAKAHWIAVSRIFI